VNRPFDRSISAVFAGPDPRELGCQYNLFSANHFWWDIPQKHFVSDLFRGRMISAIFRYCSGKSSGARSLERECDAALHARLIWLCLA